MGLGLNQLLKSDKPSPSGPKTGWITQTLIYLSGIQRHTLRLPPCVKTHTAPGYITGAPRALPTARPSLLRFSAPHAPIVGHVPLWDRLPPLQVDRAPAAALRHYFRHHRHRRHLGMGGGRGRQVSLRQHVGALPGQERRLDLQDAHGQL